MTNKTNKEKIDRDGAGYDRRLACNLLRLLYCSTTDLNSVFNCTGAETTTLEITHKLKIRATTPCDKRNKYISVGTKLVVNKTHFDYLLLVSLRNHREFMHQSSICLRCQSREGGISKFSRSRWALACIGRGDPWAFDTRVFERWLSYRGGRSLC